ncbi:DUF1015 domain-containing protein [Neglectibacter caecimuris]|uniref:DUF1015 domain-containing protein n=1 Tax=Neglectibacter caecimuris TaxID=3093658 RepID=UPI002AC983CD|nr:DUF1015 domain-containing protein [Neglectibacter sp. M00184]
MAEIRPFRALRYDTRKAGDIKELVCPPYDIISEEEYRAYLAQNPYNMIRLELPKGENPYSEAGNVLKEWLESGVLREDMDEGVYIYEEEFLDRVDHGETKKLRGIICRVRLEEFSAGVVLPHEETLSKAKEDRFQLMRATGCNFSQIYSLYPDEKHITRQRLDNLAASCSPRYEFSDGLVTHRLWVVNDPVSIAALREDFADRKLYIADGHHRYETALRYRDTLREENRYCPDADFVMMMLVDMEDEGLVVFPTHRLLSGLPKLDSEKLLNTCEPWFEIAERETGEKAQTALWAFYKEGRHAFGFFDGARWHTLVLRDSGVMEELLPEKSQAYRNLDVTILHSLILERLLGIDKENMAAQKNLRYTRSAQEAEQSVRAGESQCCFLLNPTRVSEIGAVAAAGEKMPQKSTYFYPKLITGLVMSRLFDEAY